MQVVLLAGGKGSRLQEETVNIPKPLVEIEGKPILWHIMKIYEHYDHKEFILCLGYKSEMIKEYFYNYCNNNSDIIVNTYFRTIDYINSTSENFNVSLINTGVNTETGGRLLRVKDHIEEDTFFLNYSDGVSDININELLDYHKYHGKIVTLTAVRKRGKFGTLQTDGNRITSFIEKPIEDSWINGGYMVCDRKIFDYLIDGDLPLTLERLAKDNQLMAYKYNGNWQCMDTLSDKEYLENLCKTNNAFWKKW